MEFFSQFKVHSLKKAPLLFRLVLCFLFILSRGSGWLFSQHVSQDYTIKNWTIEDGLPMKSVNNIIQAENGYLWLSTTGGLVRFDESQLASGMYLYRLQTGAVTLTRKLTLIK